MHQADGKRHKHRQRQLHPYEQKVEVPGVSSPRLQEVVDEEFVHDQIAVMRQQLFVDVLP